ncbi:unnamed protein product [Closterium sp. NIES-53]
MPGLTVQTAPHTAHMPLTISNSSSSQNRERQPAGSNGKQRDHTDTAIAVAIAPGIVTDIATGIATGVHIGKNETASKAAGAAGATPAHVHVTRRRTMRTNGIAPAGSSRMKSERKKSSVLPWNLSPSLSRSHKSSSANGWTTPGALPSSASAPSSPAVSGPSPPSSHCFSFSSSSSHVPQQSDGSVGGGGGVAGRAGGNTALDFAAGVGFAGV